MESSKIQPKEDEMLSPTQIEEGTPVDKKAESHGGKEDDEEEDIGSVIDILLLEKASTPNIMLSIFLSSMQTIIYIVILTNPANVTSNVGDFNTFALVCIFASLCIANEGFNMFVDLYANALLCFKDMDFRPYKVILALLECNNFLLIFVTTAYSIPNQGSPLAVVLGCTGLVAVAKLDENTFQNLKVRGKFSKKLVKEKEFVLHKFKRVLAAVYWFGVIWTYFMIYLAAVAPPVTNEPTMQPTPLLRR